MDKASIMIGNKCLEEIKTFNKKKDIIGDIHSFIEEMGKDFKKTWFNPGGIVVNCKSDQVVKLPDPEKCLDGSVKIVNETENTTTNKQKEILSDDRLLLDEIIKVLENPLEGPLCVEINVNTDKLSTEEKYRLWSGFSWDDVDEKYNWVAIDKDGFIASYVNKPDCDHEKKEWIPGDDGDVEVVKQSDYTNLDNWKDLIWERPEKQNFKESDWLSIASRYAGTIDCSSGIIYVNHDEAYRFLRSTGMFEECVLEENARCRIVTKDGIQSLQIFVTI